MAKNIIEAQNWVEAVRDCLSKVKLWSCNRNHDTERVRMEHVKELLKLGNVPCNEPSHLQLKVELISLAVVFLPVLWTLDL